MTECNFNYVKICVTMADVAHSGLSTYEPKGRQLDSQSGHMPGLLAGSPAGGVREATNRCFSHINVSLPLFSSPLSKKINKILKDLCHL